MKKPVQRNIEHFFPLLNCHACHRRIVVHARIVDEHLNGTFIEEQFDRLSRRIGISYIKRRHSRCPAVSSDVFHHLLGGLRMPVGVHDDCAAICCQSLTDHGTDRPAAAGHQGPSLHDDAALIKIDARPSMSADPSCVTLKR